MIATTQSAENSETISEPAKVLVGDHACAHRIRVVAVGAALRHGPTAVRPGISNRPVRCTKDAVKAMSLSECLALPTQG